MGNATYAVDKVLVLSPRSSKTSRTNFWPAEPCCLQHDMQQGSTISSKDCMQLGLLHMQPWHDRNAR